MGKYSARKRSGPKKQSFKKRKYNKKMVGGEPKEEEEAAKKKKEEEAAAAEKAVVVVPEAAKKEEVKDENKDAENKDAENKEDEKIVPTDDELAQTLNKQYEALNEEDKKKADDQLKEKNINPNDIAPDDANKLALELAKAPGTPLWAKALAKSGAAGFAAKILNNNPKLKEALIEKLSQVNVSSSSPSSSSESKGDIKADWDNLLEKLSKSTDTTEISNLLIAFGKTHT